LDYALKDKAFASIGWRKRRHGRCGLSVPKLWFNHPSWAGLG